MATRSERTRRRILIAAGRVLQRTGFHGLTMAGVAAEAGVSRQAVYGHFAGKAELVVAASDHLLADALARQALPEPGPDPSGADALDRAIAAYARTIPHVFDVAAANQQARGSDPAADAAWAHRSRVRRAEYGDAFERLASEGALAPGWTPAEAAELLFVLLSVRTYEILVVEAGWTVDRYQARVREVVEATLVRR